MAAVEEDPAVEVIVDLVERNVRCGQMTVPFEIEEHTRWRLLEGLDDIALTLRHSDDIGAFESTRPAWFPRTQAAS